MARHHVTLACALSLTWTTSWARGSSLPDPSPPPGQAAPSWNLPAPDVQRGEGPAGRPKQLHPDQHTQGDKKPQPAAKKRDAHPAAAKSIEDRRALKQPVLGRQNGADAAEPSFAPEAPATSQGLVAPPVIPTAKGATPVGHQATALTRWFDAIEPPEAELPFGELVARAARAELGKPYVLPQPTTGEEVLDLNVETFQCVSFVESSIAIARCVFMQKRTPECFAQEIVGMRYRGGHMQGFASRLHYFEDWLADNGQRGHITVLSTLLGGHPVQRKTAYMTHHPHAFPALKDRRTYRKVAAMEARLSRTATPVVDAQDIDGIENRLQNGDIVAIATFRPDILVRHTGLVDRDADGVVHLLNASYTHHKVSLTKESLSGYVVRRPEREGILLARPLPPSSK